MKILTYKDPFSLDSRSYWNKIIDIPHICASQTLKNGMDWFYNKKKNQNNFNYLFTVEEIINELYDYWANNPEFEIFQYNICSQEINNINNMNLKRSFINNKRHVYDSIRFLIELDYKPENIRVTNPVMEEFKSIYNNLYCNKDFNLLKYPPKDKKIKNIYMTLNSIMEEKDTNYKHLDKDPESIVIHGVHRFSPLLMRFLDDLKDLDINIIFLINYIPEFKKIYETWEKVYSWTGAEIEFEDEGYNYNNNKGSQLAEFLNGNIYENNYFNSNEEQIEAYRYSNLTEFSHYVGDVFERAWEEKNSRSENISNMSVQFYSTDMEVINDILKQYYPQQFGEKHLLAYPIGQFILSLYNMWDMEKGELEINPIYIKEALSIGFIKEEQFVTPLETYNKFEGYFENLSINNTTSINTIISNLEIIKRNLAEIEEKPNLFKEFSKFSIYSVSREEIENLIDVFKGLDYISKELFKDRETLNYVEHYINLINLLLENPGLEINIEHSEKIILEEIKHRLINVNKKDIEGNIEDIQESLHFYLNRIEEIEEKNDSSKWIVRGFDQLDGGILVKNRNKKRKYHLAMVGDIDMNKKEFVNLPWPLSEDFFIKTDNRTNNPNIKSVITSEKEYNNYLLYSLFYALYFLEDRVEISFIEDYGEDSNNLFYLLRLLGLKPKSGPEISDLTSIFNKFYEPKAEILSDYSFEDTNLDIIKESQIVNYMYCPYKFFLEDFIGDGTYFADGFQQRLYFKNLLQLRTLERLRYEIKSKDNIETLFREDQSLTEEGEKFIKSIIKECRKELGNYYNLRLDIYLEDIEQYAYSYFLKKSRLKDYIMDNSESNYLIYKNYKIKLMNARVMSNGKNMLKGIFSSNEKAKARASLCSSIRNNENFEQRIDEELCKYCGQRDLCLDIYQKDR